MDSRRAGAAERGLQGGLDPVDLHARPVDRGEPLLGPSDHVGLGPLPHGLERILQRLGLAAVREDLDLEEVAASGRPWPARSCWRWRGRGLAPRGREQVLRVLEAEAALGVGVGQPGVGDGRRRAWWSARSPRRTGPRPPSLRSRTTCCSARNFCGSAPAAAGRTPCATRDQPEVGDRAPGLDHRVVVRRRPGGLLRAAIAGPGGVEGEDELGVDERLGHGGLDLPGDGDDRLEGRAGDRAAELDELAGERRAAGLGLAEQGLDRLGRDAPGVADPHRAVGQDGRQPGQEDLVRRQVVLALAEPAALEAEDLRQRVAHRVIPDDQAVEQRRRRRSSPRAGSGTARSRGSSR